MKRKITIVAFCVTLFALTLSAHAQQPKKIYRLGYLGNSAGIGPVQEAFRKICTISGSLKIKT